MDSYTPKERVFNAIDSGVSNQHQLLVEARMSSKTLAKLVKEDSEVAKAVKSMPLKAKTKYKQQMLKAYAQVNTKVAKGVSIRRACQLCGLSRTSYYNLREELNGK
ncbi:hypothetical protein vBAmePPT11V19_00058 [Alteromonas phage vB_AmeP_PT11-V19]|nr:hypothetical protein vBAmePPT11V19_00058 [Alteromonas phage vB_AmeP_PT11-V19]